MADSVIHDLSGFGLLAEETSSWPYRHDRDLTSIDGWENPTLLDAHGITRLYQLCTLSAARQL
jgi:putative iron-dependent peroxidase